ncbi:unnamed protein product [Lampetra planeri]
MGAPKARSERIETFPAGPFLRPAPEATPDGGRRSSFPHAAASAAPLSPNRNIATQRLSIVFVWTNQNGSATMRQPRDVRDSTTL